MTEPDQARREPSLEDEMLAHAQPASTDLLERIRELVRQRVALGRDIEDIENHLGELNRRRHDIDTRQLPDLFMEAGVDHLGVADVNVDAKLSDYYKASIPMDWPADRKQAAFDKLLELGLEAIIRRTVESSFGPGERGWLTVVAELERLGIGFSVRDVVPWQTLTAAVRRMCEEGDRPSAADLETIGAFVGRIVTIKPRSASPGDLPGTARRAAGSRAADGMQPRGSAPTPSPTNREESER